MATKIVMPKLGLTMEEGTVLEWYCAVGDTVERQQPLAQVEGDKNVAELESPVAGVVLALTVAAGVTVPVGAPVAIVGAAGETIAGAPSTSSTAENGAGATSSAAAPSGAAAADTAPTGAPDSDRSTGPSAATAPDAANQPDRPGQTTGSAGTAKRVLISPRARRLAEEAGLDWQTLRGSDLESGRIQERDVRAALATRGSAGERIPFTALRATIARRLQQSAQSAPHIHLWTEIDTTELRAVRRALSSAPAPTYGTLIVMAAARALREHPQLNAAVEDQAVVRFKEIHISMAIGLDEGVIAPVIRNADALSAAQLQSTSADLITRARDRTLRPEELSGGTFSISNLGATAVGAFTAIINPPQVAILTVGAIQDRPAAYQGQVALRPMVTVGLAADHRAVDGVHAAAYLTTLKKLLEEPGWMLNHG